MFFLTVTDHFDAAHFLRDYPGKCAQIHGHRWTVEVTVSGQQLDNIGMLVDFKHLKNVLKDKLAEFDHHLINEHEPFVNLNPTAENLAQYVYLGLVTGLTGVSVTKVRVYETPDAWAEYREG
ncbi:MAG TPA: 6-carboxytetrahydropterin synthase QueD [Desulfobacteria bacterium]|nr:6-carboxytetrahydropterin synthase QueD [Desulfobacteria bacterium]